MEGVLTTTDSSLTFSKIAIPLQSLTHKDVQFVSTEGCACAFQILKKELSYAPVLSYLSFEKLFILETDASIEGLGAMLSQSEEIICYILWLMPFIH